MDKKIGWYNEDATFDRDHLRTTFDVLSMGFLRNPAHDPTLVAMIDFDALGDRLRQTLSSPRFRLLTSLAQQGDRNAIDQPQSIIYPADSPRFSRFTFARLEEQREEWEEEGLMWAVEALIEHLDSRRVEIDGRPGDIVFIDNRRVAHARDPYRRPPRYDGSDRWQRRLGAAHLSWFSQVTSVAVSASEPRIIDNRKLSNLMRLHPDGQSGENTDDGADHCCRCKSSRHC
jgi:hypothetical protein